VFYKTHNTFSFSWNGFPHVGLKPQGLLYITTSYCKDAANSSYLSVRFTKNELMLLIKVMAFSSKNSHRWCKW